MNPGDDATLRVLVLAPSRRDAQLSESLLRDAGMSCHCCADMGAVVQELDAGGAGALVLPEESVAQEREQKLRDWLQRQPPWSDLPILVMARAGADSAPIAQAMDLLGNITLLERPMRVAALVSALRSALRARQRQYELRAHVAERESHLQALREADRRKNEFLATLAHELRNPLAPIGNSVQALRLQAPPGSSIGQIAAMMERQLTQLVRLVDDLLEMSRMTRGRIELRLESVDVAVALRSAVETSRPLIDAARHTLTVSIPAEPLPLLGDPVRLAQIFSNLLNNAAKYTEEGGRIWLTAYREGMAVVVAVRDSGTGIPPEMLPRVFGLFTQLPGHARQSHGGLGIGLTLVKTLVEMHGGTVRASSAGPGKGSEFIVRLPLAAEDARAVTPPATTAAVKLRPRRVLVVDDNRDAAESLAMLLGLMGHTTRVAHGGVEALAALPAFKPSLVFLDIGMPEMDGHEVARRMRALPDGANLVLIALTGWGQDEDRRRSQQAGFDHHLIKPVDVRALEAFLRSLDAGVAPADRAFG